MKIAASLLCMTVSLAATAQDGRGKSLSDYAAERKTARLATPRLPGLVALPAPELLISKWFNTDPIRLRDLRGKVVLLDFWAISCPPCLDAIPELHKLGNSQPDLVVVTIHPPKTANREKSESGKDGWRISPAEQFLPGFMSKRRFTLPVGIDHNESTARLYRVKAVPLYLLIDREGVVRYEGHAIPSQEQLARLLSKGRRSR